VLVQAIESAARDERNDSFRQLFGIEDEDLLFDFECCLLKTLLLKGHMYVTERSMYFKAVVTDQIREGPPLVRGYLDKKHRRRAVGPDRWGRRYFLLEKDTLSIFKDENADKPSGVIPIKLVVSVRGLGKKKKNINNNIYIII
jgi:hypothetical protein